MQICISQYLARFLNTCEAICFSGSTVIGGVTPESDIDIVVLVPSFNDAAFYLEGMGFKLDGKDYGCTDDTFRSYKKDAWNIIVVNRSDYFAAWRTATKLATDLGCQTREERVTVFRTVWDEKGLVQ